RHFPLDRDGAAYGIDNAVELDQQPVSHRAHDATPVLGDLWIDEILAHRSERRQGALLVDAHQPGIADDIGAQNDGKPMFYFGICHSLPASPRISFKQRSPEDTRVKPLRAEFPYLIRAALLP